MTILELKERWLRTAAAVGFAVAVGFAAPAFAQDEEAPPEGEPAAEEVVEEAEAEAAAEDTITVTGSRLRRDAFTSASPIQVVDGEQSRDIGLIDAADLVQQTSVVQGQQFDLGLSTSAGINPTDNPSGPGSANISLRGLAAGRTLVLVNGRRLAPAGVRGAPSAPDVNLIPGSMIERVEILLDGASSIYGSDAVAGVVNYILRKDFDGVEIDAFYDVPEMGDMAGQRQNYSIRFGQSGDRGFVNFAVEWSQQQEVTLEDMADFFPRQFEFCGNRLWHQDSTGKIFNSQCGGGAVGSRLIFSPVGILFREPGANVAGLPPGWRPVAVTPLVITAGEPSAVDLLIHPEDRGSFFQPEFERLILYSTGEYEVSSYGSMTAYYEASYSIRDTLDVTHGQGAFPVTADFPLNPFPGFDYTLFFRDTIEVETTVSQTRLIGGVRGDLPFMDGGTWLKDWYYDMYGSYSISDGLDRVQGLLDSSRLIQFLSTAHISPITGELACDPLSLPGDSVGLPFVECFGGDPFDPFFMDNGRFQDEDANRFLFPNRMESTRLEQTIFNAYAGGTVIDLPAGPMKALAGFEYRKDEIETQTDGPTSEGEFNEDGFADRGATGQRSLWEVFFELEAPLVTGKRFVEELNINFAGRYTNEENFGSAFTYAFRGQYAPFKWLRFRGTYGTSFRAPDVGEQFGTQLLGLSDFTGAGDPCLTPGVAIAFFDHDNDPTTPAIRVYDPNLDPRSQDLLDRCANGGGPFNFPGVDPTNHGIAGLGTNNLVFVNNAPLVAEGSNPDLEPETSKSWTGGIVIEQPWYERFDFRVAATYFDITVENQVVELSEVEVVTTCYNDEGLDDPLCAFMTRSPLTGDVNFVNAQLQNIGVLTAKGLDLNVAGGFDFDFPGTSERLRFDFIANATRSFENNETLVTETDEQLTEHGFPEWRANFTGILRWQDLGFLWRTRFVDSTIEDTTDPIDVTTSSFSECIREGVPFAPDANSSRPYCISVDNTTDYWVHDLSLTYGRDTWRLRAGISNVFDTTPPEANAPIRGVGYDLFGRTYFFNATKKF